MRPFATPLTVVSMQPIFSFASSKMDSGAATNILHILFSSQKLNDKAEFGIFFQISMCGFIFVVSTDHSKLGKTKKLTMLQFCDRG